MKKTYRNNYIYRKKYFEQRLNRIIRDIPNQNIIEKQNTKFKTKNK